jgi:hypothetical protein
VTYPGKQAVLVCEVLTKTSFLDKKQNRSHFMNLSKELDAVSVKLKPFFGNRKFILRLTSLDGLVMQEDIQNL